MLAHESRLAVIMLADTRASDGAGLILGLRPAKERLRYFVTTSLVGWVQT